MLDSLNKLGDILDHLFEFIINGKSVGGAAKKYYGGNQCFANHIAFPSLVSSVSFTLILKNTPDFDKDSND